MEVVATSDPLPSASEQNDMISKLFDKHGGSARQCNDLFVAVPMDFWRKWCSYSGYVDVITNGGASASASSSSSSSASPKPMDMDDILDRKLVSDYTSETAYKKYILSSSLHYPMYIPIHSRTLRDRHFLFVPKPVFECFEYWYGRNHFAPVRSVKDDGMNGPALEAEPLKLPLFVQTCPSTSPMALRKVYIVSRHEPVNKLLPELAKAIHAKPDEIRLYCKSGSQFDLIDESKSLHDNRLQDVGDELLIEKKNDMAWPRDSPSASSSSSTTAAMIATKETASATQATATATATASSFSGRPLSLQPGRKRMASSPAQSSPKQSWPSTILNGVKSIFSRPFSSSQSSSSTEVVPRSSASASTRPSSYSSFRSSYMSRSYSRTYTRGVCGLQNLGNTCFMNSALQCLSHTAALTSYFLQGHHQSEINSSNPLGLGGQLANAYAKTLEELWSGKNSSINPRDLKYVIGRFATQFQGYQQHDSQELIAFVLDGLHEDLNRITNKPYVPSIEANGRPDIEVANEAWRAHLSRNQSIIVDLFHGQFRSEVSCPDCSKVSVTFDPFMYLSLPLSRREGASRDWQITLVPCSDQGTPLEPRFATLTSAKYATPKDIAVWASDQLDCNPSYCSIIECYERYSKQEVDLHTRRRNRDRIDLSQSMVFVVQLPVAHFRRRRAMMATTENLRFSEFGELEFKEAVKICNRHNVLLLDTYLHNFVEELRRTRSVFYDKLFGFGVDDSGRPVARGAPLSDEEVNEWIVRANNAARRLRKLMQEWPLFAMIVPMHKPNFSARVCGAPSFMPIIGSHTTMRELLEEIRRVFGATPENTEEIQLVNDVRQMERISSRRMAAILEDAADDTLCQASGDIQVNIIFRSDIDATLAPKPRAMQGLPRTPVSRATRGRSSRGAIALDECFEMFMEPETLGHDDEWYCSDCKQHKRATKKMDIWKVPDVLVIHLKRFRFAGHSRRKISALVDYPVRGLDISRFVIGPDQQLRNAADASAADASASSSSSSSAAAAAANSDDTSPYLYDLYGISDHSGSLGFGHYTAYALNGGSWYMFNDSHTSSTSVNNIKSEQNYVLFYRRRHRVEKEQFPEVKASPFSPEQLHTVATHRVNSDSKMPTSARSLATTTIPHNPLPPPTTSLIVKRNHHGLSTLTNNSGGSSASASGSHEPTLQAHSPFEPSSAKRARVDHSPHVSTSVDSIANENELVASSGFSLVDRVAVPSEASGLQGSNSAAKQFLQDIHDDDNVLAPSDDEMDGIENIVNS
jgi:ubiquitin C-terminal hydrolase